MTRIRTTGILEAQLEISGLRVYTGGERNERKKWRKHLPIATALVFVASLSEYDEVLFEDDVTHSMKESFHLFEEVFEMRDDLPIILLLNKMDLFQEKIKNIPLSDYFPEFCGGDDYFAACEFILSKFLDRCPLYGRDHFHYFFVSAADPTSVIEVFEQIVEIAVEHLTSNQQLHSNG
eukprot:TRINITY_DN16046_c0_g1_i8.p1 TRINITY_DN16046_c0_g1~~TRINITY_DN16046_c0_g1_i8.p1  ORF type:complete len:178 (-),score=40.28 TRINITY_DN16046_c0_g1_i8:82-615(-)